MTICTRVPHTYAPLCNINKQYKSPVITLFDRQVCMVLPAILKSMLHNSVWLEQNGFDYMLQYFD